MKPPGKEHPELPIRIVDKAIAMGFDPMRPPIVAWNNSPPPGSQLCLCSLCNTQILAGEGPIRNLMETRNRNLKVVQFMELRFHYRCVTVGMTYFSGNGVMYRKEGLELCAAYSIERLTQHRQMKEKALSLSPPTEEK